LAAAKTWHIGAAGGKTITPLPEKPSYGKFAFDFQPGDIIYEKEWALE
jgi:hypothetical protein